MPVNFKISIRLISILLISTELLSQTGQDSLIIIPQENYKAGLIHRFIFGDHWRDAWITAVKVPVLDLTSFAGGLSPFKTGGGMQTKSLQLMGNNGKIYKFRSVDKFPARSLPDDLKGSLVETFMQDQITTINPYSSVIISSLIDKTGILHSESGLYVMPDADLLGSFRKEFGNMLGSIEEKADEYDKTELNFAGAVKIRDTFKMLDELEEDNDNYVLASDYLKARLFDIFIGDRDRHSGQWDWAEYRKGKNKIYKPIPKDRDFAFPLYDGLIPRLLTLAITSYVHFDFNMPSMLDMTWEGRHLDRRILGVLSKSEWDSAASFLQSVLTDNVINESVRSVPIRLQNYLREELVGKLISRRDQLKYASDEFYSLISKVFDIHLSNKSEYAEIKRDGSDLTIVSIYKKDGKSGRKKNNLIYYKQIDHKFTEEVRLHLKDGDDTAVISGYSDNPILIIIDGGKGKDELIDSSEVKAFSGRAEFYDSGRNTFFYSSGSTRINTERYSEPEEDAEKYEPRTEDRHHDFGVLFPFAISSDYGLVLGGGGGFNFYDYRIKPYSYRLEAEGSYAYSTESWRLRSTAYFNELIENTGISITGKISQIEINRFNGLGNETIRDEKLNGNEYYQVEQNRYSLGLAIRYPIIDKIDLCFSAAYEGSVIKDEREVPSFLNDFSFYGEEDLSFLEFSAGITLDYLDAKEFPYSGCYFNLDINYLPQISGLKSDIIRTEYDLRTYFENNLVTNNTISLRSSGAVIIGDYPFFLGSSLGGSKSLRGIPTNRYIGDASLLFQTEWRLFLGKPRIIVPGKFGIKFFAETGRVFYEKDSSKLWHHSLGGGIYFDILDRLLSIHFDVAASRDYTRYYFYFTRSF